MGVAGSLAGGGNGGSGGGGGAPSGLAGGDLSGTYPNPSVVDDSHSHTAATLPAFGDTVGPVSSTDNALARYDGTTGKLMQDGVVTETDAGILSGVTQLNVDNIRLDGNTVSTTNANGDLSLAPNGTGSVSVLDSQFIIKDDADPTKAFKFQASGIAAGQTRTITIPDSDITIGAGGVTDHGALTGLADDDHAQYALLAGRSGGTIINGGTAAGNKMVIRPNSVDSTSYTEIQNGVGGAVVCAFRNAQIEPYKNMFGQASGASPAVMFGSAPSSTTPSFIPNGGDSDTGLGHAGSNQLSLIAGALEVLRAAAGLGSANGPILFIPNLTTAPSVSPIGGVYMYPEAGALKVRGTSGTVTTIAPA